MRRPQTLRTLPLLSKLEVDLDLFKGFNSLGPQGSPIFFFFFFNILPPAILPAFTEGSLEWRQDFTDSPVACS